MRVLQMVVELPCWALLQFLNRLRLECSLKRISMIFTLLAFASSLLFVVDANAKGDFLLQDFVEHNSEMLNTHYRAQCITDGGKRSRCTLLKFAVLNARAEIYQCSMRAYNIFDHQTAKYSDGEFILEDEERVCNEKTVYRVSKTGMLITKTYPKTKTNELCKTGKPEVTRIQPTGADPKGLSVHGCQELKVLMDDWKRKL